MRASRDNRPAPTITKHPTPSASAKRNFCTPSETNTPPTSRRTKRAAAGPSALAIRCTTETNAALRFRTFSVYYYRTLREIRDEVRDRVVALLRREACYRPDASALVRSTPAMRSEYGPRLRPEP
jgi:hypothetical protein